MISSQDGTEDRRPRAALRFWRPVCSAPASACSAASPVAAGGSAVVSAGSGGAAGWLSSTLSAATRGTGADSRDAGSGQEFRSAAGGRATSVLGSPVTDTEGAGGADGTGTGTAGSEADGRTGADAGRSCRALLCRGASWVIVASPGSGAAG